MLYPTVTTTTMTCVTPLRQADTGMDQVISTSVPLILTSKTKKNLQCKCLLISIESDGDRCGGLQLIGV